jgi:hypothetical protein
MRTERAGGRQTATVRRVVAIVVAAVLAAIVAPGALTACSSDGDEEPPAQLDRIDQPAQVDEDRLDGQPGAANDDGSGG